MSSPHLGSLDYPARIALALSGPSRSLMVLSRISSLNRCMNGTKKSLFPDRIIIATGVLVCHFVAISYFKMGAKLKNLTIEESSRDHASPPVSLLISDSASLWFCSSSRGKDHTLPTASDFIRDSVSIRGRKISGRAVPA